LSGSFKPKMILNKFISEIKMSEETYDEEKYDDEYDEEKYDGEYYEEAYDEDKLFFLELFQLISLLDE
jgi:hypothetical protein